jgi:phage replication-related protein YjqB (UPF0714/DUF867 family)
MRNDRYKSFADLAAHETENVDYRISVIRRPGSSIAVIAPHGGGIEPRTSDIARTIAGEEFNLYLFEGIKASGNAALHVASHQFDEPSCLALIGECSTVIAIHGCDGEGERVLIGGFNLELKAHLAVTIRKAGVQVDTYGHSFQATDRNNICNRGRSGTGVQLELTASLRGSANTMRLVRAVRSVLLPIDAGPQR